MTADRLMASCRRAIDAGLTPGAVVLVGRGNEVLCHLAVGHRALVPKPLPMKLSTVFDLASLTKPVATATDSTAVIDTTAKHAEIAAPATAGVVRKSLLSNFQLFAFGVNCALRFAHSLGSAV